MYDEHHLIRNAVVGALKQMGKKKPLPTLEFIGKFLDHEDSAIRRQMIHGMELRGRTHPEDVLPLLKSTQDETDKNIRDMIIHVIGQISYKKNCLEKVIKDLKTWENHQLVKDSLYEILKVHKNYEKFSYKTLSQAREYIDGEFADK